jgi:cyclopropane fatty-acyl-phospholipid synthase-like methyltransferase
MQSSISSIDTPEIQGQALAAFIDLERTPLRKAPGGDLEHAAAGAEVTLLRTTPQPELRSPPDTGTLDVTRAFHLEHPVVFKDPRLAQKYAATPIPIATLYEGYFDGSVDILGDLSDFMRKRQCFVRHTITRHHLQWALENFAPARGAGCASTSSKVMRRPCDEHGEDFFRAFLGERMAHSCAHFLDPADSLERAQDQALARVCTKLTLRPGHRLLDVGCGWGALIRHASVEGGAVATGVTPSASQASYVRRQIAALGSQHRARVIGAEHRAIPAEKFDRIVCLEVAETIDRRNAKAFFGQLWSCLEDDGVCLMQWTGLRRKPKPEEMMWGLFVNKFIIPGADGALPLSSMLETAEDCGWEVRSVENVSVHYVHTLRRWRHNWEMAREMVVERHGERWFRIWHFFLIWSELVAEEGGAACYQVLMNKNLAQLNRHALPM